MSSSAQSSRRPVSAAERRATYADVAGLWMVTVEHPDNEHSAGLFQLSGCALDH